MGTGVMGHMGNVACPPSRSTWGMVMGYMSNGAHGYKGQGDGNRGDSSRWGTGVMGHMGNGAHNGCIQ